MNQILLNGDLTRVIVGFTLLLLAAMISSSGSTLALSSAVIPPFHARNLQMAEQLAHQMLIHRGHNNHQQLQLQHQFQEPQNSGLKLDAKQPQPQPQQLQPQPPQQQQQQQQVQEAILAPPVINQPAQGPQLEETRKPPAPAQALVEAEGPTKQVEEETKTQAAVVPQPPEDPNSAKADNDSTVGNGDLKTAKTNNEKQPLLPRILKGFGLGLGFVGKK